MWVCAYLCIHLCLHQSVPVCACLCTYTCVHACVLNCVCMLVYICVCACLCACVCMHVYSCVCVRVHTHPAVLYPRSCTTEPSLSYGAYAIPFYGWLLISHADDNNGQPRLWNKGKEPFNSPEGPESKPCLTLFHFSESRRQTECSLCHNAGPCCKWHHMFGDSYCKKGFSDKDNKSSASISLYVYVFSRCHSFFRPLCI